MTLAPEFRIKRLEPQNNAARVTGSEQNVADLSADGMLHGRILVSPHANARIRSIHTSKALGLPGVVAVLTHADCPAPPALGGSPRTAPLLSSQARFAGDWIAVVAAEAGLIAEEALGLIEIDYEPLPAVLDIAQALETGVHGDVKAAVANAARTAAFAGIASQPLRVDFGQQAAFAAHDAGGDVTVISAADGHVAERSLEAVAALLVKTCARPVKVVEPELADAFSRQASAHHAVRMAANEKGAIVALDHVVVVDAGAYSEGETVHADIATLTGALRVDSLSGAVSTVYTHTPPTGSAAMSDTVNSGFIVQQAVDMLAETLDMDPLEFRLNNLVAGEAGARMDACIRAGVDRFDWLSKWHGWARDRAAGGRYRQGIGLSILSRHHDGQLFGHQADFVEVEVDTETGFTVLLSHVCALDITDFRGLPDPVQLQASVLRSIGNALIEDSPFGGSGTAAVTGALRAPTIMDAPDLDYVFTGTPLPEGADGGHDPARAGSADLAPAMANAIYDAGGIRMTTLPFSADAILRSLHAQAWRYEPKGE
jgi:CO/xanthine dehydrogenase Mo-binding subunit